jgi:hypothetical protein
MTDELMACLFVNWLASALSSPTMHPKGFGAWQSTAASYFMLQAFNSIENQLGLTLSVKSSCGYYM